MPIASLVRDRMLAATAQGMGEADWAAIARISFREAGLSREFADNSLIDSRSE